MSAGNVYVRNNPAVITDSDGHEPPLQFNEFGHIKAEESHEKCGIGCQVKKWWNAYFQGAMDETEAVKSGYPSVPNSNDGVLTPSGELSSSDVLQQQMKDLEKGTAILSDVFSVADVGYGSVLKDMSKGDNKGALLSAVFIVLTDGTHVNLAEAKSLVGAWGEGSFKTLAKSLRYHYGEHGAEVGADNIWQYLRKAKAFRQNLKGATRSSVLGPTSGVTRYVKQGKYIDLDVNRKIISFGKN